MNRTSQNDEDIEFLNAVIAEATRALENRHSPFAAAVVKNGRLLSLFSNETVASGSEIDHAEVLAIRRAFEATSASDVENSTLYSSCEPCIMCLSTAFYAGIRRIVFAAPIEEAISRGSGDANVKAAALIKFANLPISLEQSSTLASTVIKLFDIAMKKRGKL